MNFERCKIVNSIGVSIAEHPGSWGERYPASTTRMLSYSPSIRSQSELESEMLTTTALNS